MDEMTDVRRAVDRLLGGDLEPMLDLLAEDVDFEVTPGGDFSGSRTESGKEAVAGHFAALGELVAFWQIDYGAEDGQVIAWGKESFTAEHCGLEGACEFALVFDLAHGKVTRFQVIEDLGRFLLKGHPQFAPTQLRRHIPLPRHLFQCA
jgi:ketosteroid isomerase-like protein